MVYFLDVCNFKGNNSKEWIMNLNFQKSPLHKDPTKDFFHFIGLHDVSVANKSSKQKLNHWMNYEARLVFADDTVKLV